MKIKNLRVERWTGDEELVHAITKEKTVLSNIRFEQWFWTHNGKGYRTNRNGSGVWEVGKHQDKQTSGTLDFSLRGMSMSGARRKLNRMFEDRVVWND